MRRSIAVALVSAAALAGCQTIDPPVTLDNARYVRVDLPNGSKIDVQVTTHLTTVRQVAGESFVETATQRVASFCADPQNHAAGQFYSIPKIEDLGWNVSFAFYCLAQRVPTDAKLPAITTITAPG